MKTKRTKSKRETIDGGNSRSRHSTLVRKGVTQIDYIVAAGVFILVFALVVQFTSNYFSNIGDRTTTRVITDQAKQLLDVAERGTEPANWPYDARNDSLILIMHLDNSTLDSGQYGNNGTISGANCSASVAGRLDSACSFDGIDDYIAVADSASLNITSEISILTWIKWNGEGNGNGIVVIKQNKAGQSGASYGIIVLSDGTPSFSINTADNPWNDYTSNITLTEGVWYHVAGTYRSGELKVYVNGNLTAFYSTPTGNLNFANGPLNIGREDSWSVESFNGTIDEVLIFNRSLSDEDVYNHYAYENLLDRIGLMSNAYEFYIIVNNTLPYARNQAAPVVTIASEIVSFNYTDLGVPANVPSTVIYEQNGTRIPYSISGNTITFSTSIVAGTAKYFTVHFDDDSNFAERTAAVTGIDNLTETIGHIQALPIIQYRNLLFLNNSNYTRVVNATGLPKDFSMRLIDIGTSATILNFGPPPPPSGNIIAFQRYAIYQNSTGDIRRGRLVIQTW